MISKKLQSNTTLPNKNSYKSDKIIFVQFTENIFGSNWNYWIIFIRNVLQWKVLYIKNYVAPSDFLHVLVIITVTFLEFRTESSVSICFGDISYQLIFISLVHHGIVCPFLYLLESISHLFGRYSLKVRKPDILSDILIHWNHTWILDNLVLKF